MQQSPGMSGKAAAPQGKAGAAPGKGGAMPQGGGKQGAQGAPPAASPSIQARNGMVEGGGPSMVTTGHRSTEGAAKPGFPIFSPQAQGFEGASSGQQNPNEGGASSSNSAIMSPSTSQGGMSGV